MKKSLIRIKSLLNEIIQKSHRSGYDFNDDPAHVTLLEGEIFSIIEKNLASEPCVQGGRVITEHHDICPFCEQELPKRGPILCSEEPAA